MILFQNVWLRRVDPHHFGYTKCTDQYIPACVNNDNCCFCGYPKETDKDKCKMCSSDIYREVTITVALGELSEGLKMLLSVCAEYISWFYDSGCKMLSDQITLSSFAIMYYPHFQCTVWLFRD